MGTSGSTNRQLHCVSGHTLRLMKIGKETGYYSHTCDRCAQELKEEAWRCRACDYDICSVCAELRARAPTGDDGAAWRAPVPTAPPLPPPPPPPRSPPVSPRAAQQRDAGAQSLLQTDTAVAAGDEVNVKSRGGATRLCTVVEVEATRVKVRCEESKGRVNVSYDEWVDLSSGRLMAPAAAATETTLYISKAAREKTVGAMLYSSKEKVLRDEGCVVTAVTPGSAADRAGITVGMRLVRVAGRAVMTGAAVKRALAEAGPRFAVVVRPAVGAAAPPTAPPATAPPAEDGRAEPPGVARVTVSSSAQGAMGFEIGVDLTLTNVQSETPAWHAGLQHHMGKKLVQINGVGISQIKDCAQFTGVNTLELLLHPVDLQVALDLAQNTCTVRKGPLQMMGATWRNETLRLVDVVGGSAAARAGLRGFVGRRLTHADGAPVSTIADVRRAAHGCSTLELRFAEERLQLPLVAGIPLAHSSCQSPEDIVSGEV